MQFSSLKNAQKRVCDRVFAPNLTGGAYTVLHRPTSWVNGEPVLDPAAGVKPCFEKSGYGPAYRYVPVTVSVVIIRVAETKKPSIFSSATAFMTVTFH